MKVPGKDMQPINKPFHPRNWMETLLKEDKQMDKDNILYTKIYNDNIIVILLQGTSDEMTLKPALSLDLFDISSKYIHILLSQIPELLVKI